MEHNFSHNPNLLLEPSPKILLPPTTVVSLSRSPLRRRFALPVSGGARRGVVVVVAAAGGGGGYSHCEFGNSLNTPLEPRTAAGRLLAGVLQNDRRCFHDAVAEQLETLVAEREEAARRWELSKESDEACLHRRIADMKNLKCQTAVEDIMYMLIFFKFSEIRVLLIPKLSKCIYNGRLEILPSKDWELESIHPIEVLEMVREHLSSVVGWRANSNVTENWATTKIRRSHLSMIYKSSILYGYFLKSASLRYQLEMSLADIKDDVVLNSGNNLPLPELCNYGQKNVVFGGMGSPPSFGRTSKKQEKLSSYLLGFEADSLEMFAKPNSLESMNLIEKHTSALFGIDGTGFSESAEVISTSTATLKRFVLEAIAFGSFLWDTEEYVKTVYDLEEFQGVAE